MEKTDFVEWLQEELDKRNWRKADLARASGISSAHITRIMKREQGSGPETCTSIARALKLPPETIFRKAGLLSPKNEEPPTLSEWIHLFLQADEREQDRMLEIAKTLLRESQKGDERG